MPMVAVGAGDAEGRGRCLERDVGDSRLEKESREHFAVLDHFCGRFDQGLPRCHDRARAAGAAAVEEQVAVALDQVDLVERDAEAVDQDLGEGGGVALAVVEGAGGDGHPAVLFEPDAAHLFGRRCGDLEVAGEAVAAELAGGGGSFPSGGEAGPVGARQAGVEHGREVAAVVGQAGERRVGNRVRWDHVLAAERCRIAVGRAGGGVDQALHDVVGLGPAGAAVGADRHGVGEDAGGADREHWRAIEAGQVLEHVGRRHGRAEGGQIGAHLGDAVDPDRQEITLGIEGQLAFDPGGPALVVGDEAVGPLVAPFDRPAELLGGVQDRNRFGVGGGLHAERAADVGGAHLQPLGRNAEEIGGALPEAEHALTAGVQEEPIGGGIVGGDGGARLHGGDHDPVVDQGDAGDMGGGGERPLDRFDIAGLPVEADVAVVVVQARGVGRLGRQRVDHHRQRLDLDLDQLGGVAGGGQALGHDHRQDLAHMTDPAGRQQRPGWREQGAAVDVLERHLAAQRAIAGGLEVGRGDHRQHARCCQRRGWIEPLDDAVRHLGAEDEGVGLAGQADIVGIAPGPGDQRRVLLARHRLADAEPKVGQVLDYVIHVEAPWSGRLGQGGLVRAAWSGRPGHGG